ncbi:DNA-binding transcriptional LysR family regulator [Aminobacter niigataensis]|uniref:DNA-binding transcriptional LysR family regulator n=2 Tax=Aminobacter niigataensis TaxID=83265 RepID=A0ABR6LBN1_9HYPH|nr:hypothetical protein [Aminobacter niigataensis]MBB4653415.1 DNA-binding transcriptional LysR family regulator [Aminobacter niigataensis]
MAYALQRIFNGQGGLVLVAAAALTVGIGYNWSWLVAAGIAPLLLSVLPCVAMCVLGLCMSRMKSSSCHSDAVSEEASGKLESEGQAQ